LLLKFWSEGRLKKSQDYNGGLRRMAEKTLLQQIREKELMLNIKIEDTLRETEEIILTARKEASEMIEKFERDGKAAAQEYYEKEIEKMKKEIEQVRIQANQQAMSVKEQGERNLPLATEKIVKRISME
jgi:vacuolar-type H+-ATPase subunit H